MSDLISQTITVETLPVLAHQGLRVVTTDLLAQLYGTEGKNIHDNFTRNADRFDSGKHYFKIEGAALREFKNYTAQSGLVGKRAPHLLLWTERGAARHAKMLDTDQAWEVFERLEDAYFRVQAEPVTPISAPTPYTLLPRDTLTAEEQTAIRDTLAKAAEALPKEKQRRFLVEGWSKLKTHFNCSYREIPRAEFAEAMSLVSRHVASYLPEPLALTSSREQLARERLCSARFGVYFEAGGSMIIQEIPEGKIMLAPGEMAAYIGDPGGAIPLKMLPEIIESAAGRLRRACG